VGLGAMPRGVKRTDDRRVLNGIFHVLRTGRLRATELLLLATNQYATRLLYTIDAKKLESAYF